VSENVTTKMSSIAVSSRFLEVGLLELFLEVGVLERTRRMNAQLQFVDDGYEEMVVCLHGASLVVGYKVQSDHCLGSKAEESNIDFLEEVVQKWPEAGILDIDFVDSLRKLEPVLTYLK
jgi:hypothetical protein